MISRKHLQQTLDDHLKEISRKPVNVAEGGKEATAYEMGRALGYQDGIKAALAMVEQLPAEPKPEPQRPWNVSPREWDEHMREQRRKQSLGL